MVKIGMIIGDRYEILEKIGTGGMSDVYKAKCHKLKRYVAVKVLKQEFSENANFVSKFRIEAQAAAGLMHPNIVNVYDVGEENGIYYIVMELVEGITLKRYIEKKARLTYKEAVSIAIQVSMGIEAAHNNHIIHRDIKPQNIIISREGKVKVTDFGIAKAATSNTITSNVMGSVHYTSPEQARGGYSDEKSDIYSLGITLFEMLTGRVPFNGETTVAIAIKHIQEEMPSPMDFVPEIPVSVNGIVMKCCQKSPDRRYQKMGELTADLKRSLMNPDVVYADQNDQEVLASTRTISHREVEQIKRQVSNNREQPQNGSGVSSKMRQNGQVQGEQKARNKQNSQANYQTRSTSNARINRGAREEYEYDPRMERLTTVLAVIAGLIICGIIIFLLLRVFDVFGREIEDPSKDLIISGETNETEGDQTQDRPDVRQTTVPEVVGWNEMDAKTVMENRSLIVEIEYEENEEVREGFVISTNIPGGTKVDQGTRIFILVSSGPAGVDVENVVGKTRAEAQTILTELGFYIAWEESFAEVAQGVVLRQEPVGGTRVEPGSTVTVVVSRGVQDGTVRVPNVIGRMEDEAITILTNAGFVIQSVSHVSNSQIPAGKVCYQSYSEGSYILPGTGIEIHISTGSSGY